MYVLDGVVSLSANVMVRRLIMTSRLRGFEGPKSVLLNTEGARKTNAYIPEMAIFHGRWARVFWILSATPIGVYNWTSLTY